MENLGNVSLVAFYGHKPLPLINLIQKLQKYLVNHSLVPNNFVPYQLEQVHATMIGCEAIPTELGMLSHWFRTNRQEDRYIDFSGLIDYLQHQIHFPITIRFAGYSRHREYNFRSREQHPYRRSFQLQQSAEQTIPIVIGWSWCSDRISLEIDNLRRSLQQFNLLHKYHGTTDAVDNDFYLRLGTINSKLTAAAIESIGVEIRNLLETQPVFDIDLNLSDLAFAQYQDLLLTPSSTKTISVAEITANQLEQMYLNSCISSNK